MAPDFFKKNAYWWLLFGRTALFFGMQCLFALGFWLTGSTNAWDNGAGWWPMSVFLTNLICLAVMVSQFRSDGQSYWSIFSINRETIKSDLLVMLGTLIILGPVSYLPNILLANALLGDPLKAVSLILHPLPLWAAYASFLLFPITQGLVEIPTYFSFVMPRLEARGMRRWLAVVLPSVMLGLQHVAVPFLFDLRYIAWRGLMFIPFAFMVGIIMRWRPRLLPYIVIIHILMDISFAAMLLPYAY
jgi:hypothetical protein